MPEADQGACASHLYQKHFVDFLSKSGLNYDKRKLSVYYNRGKLPKADVWDTQIFSIYVSIFLCGVDPFFSDSFFITVSI
jgi:hypothetical protein